MEREYRAFSIAERSYAEAVHELQQLAYPLEAERIGLPVLPPMLDTPETLQVCGEAFIGCMEGDRLIGMVSYKVIEDGKTLDIHRMAVHPDHFRRGVATGLLRAALAVPGPEQAVVCTGTKNEPAYALYEQAGFRPAGAVEVAPGVTLTEFRFTYGRRE